MSIILRINNENLERIRENTECIRKARERGDTTKFMLGGYLNTRYIFSKNPKYRVRSRKNLRSITEKLVNESMERIKENTREVLENG